MITINTPLHGRMRFMSPKKIINHPDWEIYWPKRITWVGFLIALVIVLLIMLGTVLLTKIGA